MIPKPGYKTTEFIATALAAVGALVAAFADKLPARYAAIAAAVATGCYAISRGLTKLGAYAPAPPPAPPAGP